MQRLNNWQAGYLRSHVLFLWPSAQTNILRYCQKLGKCLNESHHIWPIQKTSPTLVERRNRRKHDVLFRHAHFCAVMWLGESIWKDAWNIMKPTCCNCDRKNKAWSYVLARLGTSWDRTKWPWRRRNRHPQTGEPSSGSHSFQKCSVSWTCLALSFTKGTRCTSSNVKRCEEMRRDVKWCEVMWSDVKWCEDSSLPLLYKKQKWCLSLTSNCSHICGFPFLDVHPARAWNTSVSKVSTYRTVVITTCFERWKQDQEIPRQPGSALLHPQNLWFTSPSDKNSPSHPLPGNCSLWISV